MRKTRLPARPSLPALLVGAALLGTAVVVPVVALQQPASAASAPTPVPPPGECPTIYPKLTFWQDNGDDTITLWLGAENWTYEPFRGPGSAPTDPNAMQAVTSYVPHTPEINFVDIEGIFTPPSTIPPGYTPALVKLTVDMTVGWSGTLSVPHLVFVWYLGCELLIVDTSALPAAMQVPFEPGPAGPAGPAGPPGADGAPGTDGATGPQGPDGADGAPGPQGTQGPPDRRARMAIAARSARRAPTARPGRPGRTGRPGPRALPARPAPPGRPEPRALPGRTGTTARPARPVQTARPARTAPRAPTEPPVRSATRRTPCSGSRWPAGSPAPQGSEQGPA